MKKNLLLMSMLLFATGIYSQKTKFRSTEMDTLTVAQAMFDDQNFVMAYPYLNQLQKDHPNEPFLKYMVGICSLFREDCRAQGLTLLLDVYKDNKRAEDIEYYLALAYHYNNNFAEAITMVDKYLSKKALTKPQRRGGEKLKDFCQKGEVMVAAPDEGKLDDYISILDEEEQK